MTATTTHEPPASRWPVALLAATYERCMVAADSAGVVDPLNLHFVGWLAGCWRYDGPPEPIWPPQAISTARGHIQAMRWYASDRTVLGYAPGARGCYVVPAAGPSFAD